VSHWIVNIRGRQQSAATMDDVRTLARNGDLGPGDLVQPPGARDWIYASEVPEFAAVLRPSSETPGMNTAPTNTARNAILGAVLGIAGVGAWMWALDVRSTIPTASDLSLTDGPQALPLEEAIVSVDSTTVTAEPSGGGEVAKLERNATVKLLGKKGLAWNVEVDGKPGWVSANDVIPGWYFRETERETYMPLYNPLQYIKVENAAAESGPDTPKGMAKFAFMFGNDSAYTMRGLKVELTLKDASTGRQIETRELVVTGDLRAKRSEMVATLLPKKGADPKEGTLVTDAELERMMVGDPDARDRVMDGAYLPLPEGVAVADIGVSVKITEIVPDRASKKD
jgi:hypothetical protein